MVLRRYKQLLYAGVSFVLLLFYGRFLATRIMSHGLLYDYMTAIAIFFNNTITAVGLGIIVHSLGTYHSINIRYLARVAFVTTLISSAVQAVVVSNYPLEIVLFSLVLPHSWLEFVGIYKCILSTGKLDLRMTAISIVLIYVAAVVEVFISPVIASLIPFP